MNLIVQELPVAVELAEEAVRSREGPLPPAVGVAARAALLDWAGVTIAGAESAPAVILRRAVLGGEGSCQIVGVDGKTDPLRAALVNGTAAHALELDDIYAPGLYHPGAPTIAAALAVGEQRRVNGRRLERSVAVGFEVGNRVARMLGPEHYEHWHSTGTVGGIGAAAAVAEVLELPTIGVAHALALAATMSAGLQETFRGDSMGKPLHSGHAAHVGVSAALVAEAGLTGALRVLDADRGLASASGVTTSDEAAARGRWGPDFTILETTVKPYPCCGHTFAPIDAALELRRRGARSTGVQTIEVRTYGAAIAVAGIADPSTVAEAKFSIGFAVASALRDGLISLASFTEEPMADPEIAALVRTVRLVEDTEFSAAFPHRRGARIRITYNDGRHVEARVPDRRGDPANPVTPAELEQKFRMLVGPLLGAERGEWILEHIRALDQVDDVRLLRLG